MDEDLFDDAACPASDLTARLLADLRHAEGELARVEDLFAAAANVAAATHLVPQPLRRQRQDHRQHVSALRAVLTDMAGFGGDRHTASA